MGSLVDSLIEINVTPSKPVERVNKVFDEVSKSGKSVSLDRLAHEIATKFNDKLVSYKVKVIFSSSNLQASKAESLPAMLDVGILCATHELRFCTQQEVAKHTICKAEKGFCPKPEYLAEFPIKPDYHLLAQKGIVGRALMDILHKDDAEITRQ